MFNHLHPVKFILGNDFNKCIIPYIALTSYILCMYIEAEAIYQHMYESLYEYGWYDVHHQSNLLKYFIQACIIIQY